jgi:hypothetical protein
VTLAAPSLFGPARAAHWLLFAGIIGLVGQTDPPPRLRGGQDVPTYHHGQTEQQGLQRPGQLGVRQAGEQREPEVGARQRDPKGQPDVDALASRAQAGVTGSDLGQMHLQEGRRRSGHVHVSHPRAGVDAAPASGSTVPMTTARSSLP